MVPSPLRHAPVALLLLALAACGGEGAPGPSADAQGSGSESGFTVEDGITPDDLLGCLEAAGLPVTGTDSTPMGVEVPVEGIEVGPLAGNTGGDSDQGADLWVFASAAVAADNRATITLADDDTPSSWVAGNVVVRLFYPAADGDADIASLRDCLPE